MQALTHYALAHVCRVNIHTLMIGQKIASNIAIVYEIKHTTMATA